jgi:DNA polymerase-3 subunit chi
MTRVDFYLLSEPGREHRDHTACKLVNKAFTQGHRIYVLAGSDEEMLRLDQLLWTFSAGSFVPHELCPGPGQPPQAPVLIGTGEPPDGFEDVLVTVAPDVPGCFSRFERVAEIVSGDDTDKQRARERYRFYRDRGYPLHTHNL